MAEGEHRRQAPTFACGSAAGQSRRRRELLFRDRRELVLAIAAVGKAEEGVLAQWRLVARRLVRLPLRLRTETH